jgi:hypothetical protein
MNVYTENGYKDRRDYLYSLAEDFSISPETVFTMASLLGASEDFDGLVTSLEDMEGELEYCTAESRTVFQS